MRKTRVRPIGPVAAFVLVATATQLGCLLLLWLSRFGQSPFPELPLPVLLAFGALVAGPLATVARRLSPAAVAGATALSVAILPLASSFLANTYPGAPRWLVAGGAALALAVAFRALPARPAALLSAATVYVMCTVLANYTFDAFLPLGDFFLVNVGTFFFGITFTQRDRLHRFGRRVVYVTILLAAMANVAVALGLETPLRYVVVGFLAIVLSETADTEIYARLLHRTWLVRVASSNAVSAPLDTVIFTVLAFAGEPFATPMWMWQVVATDVLVKYASSMLAALRLMRRADAPA